MPGPVNAVPSYHTEALLCRLTGLKPRWWLNNNAAAVLLALSALAKRKEVIVSRGQAVEIGAGSVSPSDAPERRETNRGWDNKLHLYRRLRTGHHSANISFIARPFQQLQGCRIYSDGHDSEMQYWQNRENCRYSTTWAAVVS